LKDQLVLHVVSKFLIPFIVMYALYVQLHGEYSPGGGFQAGVILASAFILYALVFGLSNCQKIISLGMLQSLGAIGVLIYAVVGVAGMYLGGEYLNYSVLSEDPVSGQQLGILLIEVGVGLTVFAVMLMLFFIFAARKTISKSKGR